MLKLPLIVLVLFIAGCCTKPHIQFDNSDTITHPQEPRPVTTYNYEWKMISIEDTDYIGTDYNSFIDYMSDQQDILRYIRESNAIICFYRKHFDEDSVLCIDRPDTKK